MCHQEQFDVIIVGAGPAGLMAAIWMARTGIRTLLLEKRSCRTHTGRADGLDSRTLEILDSFGIGQNIWMESNKTMEVCLWSEGLGGEIHRDSVSGNSNPRLSRFQESTLGQGRIEDHLLDFIERSPNIQIKWGTAPSTLEIHKDRLGFSSNHAIQMQLETYADPDPRSGTVSRRAVENVWAKYLVGCDGAHSWVRRRLGLSLEGESTTSGHWGVIDCVPTTDFPDIRKRCIIKSQAGSIMIIPRAGSLVRFYIELPDEVAARFKAEWRPSELLTVLSNVLKPYYLVTSRIEWSTIYTVGRSLCHRLSMHDRIFLAGDAVHTHSPKGGQGMNVSIQDTYNLGWKLASVLKGVDTPQILQTYQEERLPIADKLIKFDRQMCLGICSPFNGDGPSQEQSDKPSNSFTQLKGALAEENTTASGLSATYGSSLLVTPTRSAHSQSCVDGPFLRSNPHLAQNIVLGRRLPDALVLCQSDSHPWHLQGRIFSTGQWHLLVFSGDITVQAQMARLKKMAASLTHPDSILAHRILHGTQEPVGSLAVYLIHSAPRLEVQPTELPAIFRPFEDQNGYEYRKVFADNAGFQEGCGMAYQLYGIGTEGCLVLLRPDQHCAFVGALEDTDALEVFFSRFTARTCYNPLPSSHCH